ncbi:MAG TPA: hypothetical protein VMU94_00505 [Streptosporangiaceae bacterium]|nr:hypothetical protein [Streptosporangiaceae bacterium]
MSHGSDVSGKAASICEAAGRVFPDWRVWWHAGTFYARRTGSYLEVPGSTGAYAIWHPSPVIFVLMLDVQDRARPAGRWDAPNRCEPGAADLAKFGLALKSSPMDLARDAIAARIEGEFPGWVVDHVLTGWTAVWLDDPRYQLRTQSSVELTARLPPRGHAPRWRLG